jgi:cysteine-rich repeat protein
MRLQSVVVVLAGIAFCQACSGEDKPDPLQSFFGSSGGTGSTGNSSNAGGSHAGNGAAGDTSTGGTTPSGGVPATGGAPPSAECGNGVRESGEACDDTDFGLASCVDFGFDSGQLSCDECRADASDCSGTENCFDARDNDGDRRADCDDDDCSAACSVSCPPATTLPDPASVDGDTTGHASLLETTCALAAGNPEVVYEFVASNTGILEAELVSSTSLVLELRNSCTKSSGQCTLGQRLKTSVRAGDRLFLVVDGASIGAAGRYRLSVASRRIVCGDGFQDGSEECDDANPLDLDGCSSSCELESSEVEPNDVSTSSSDYTDPFFGSISYDGDVDFVAFELDEPALGLVAETSDFDGVACLRGDQDSMLEILDSGLTRLASDDDSGLGTCARAETGALEPGLYYVKVAASVAGDTPRFPYVLDVVPKLCGNGMLSPGEQCDDGNTLPADGCDASCRQEP